MSNHIRLHPKLGMNPRLTCCPRCGWESSELLLLGATNKVYRCQECNTPNIGKPNARDGCGKCGHWNVPFERELDASEKLPGSICDDCEKEMKEHKDEVAAGGVYFKCSDCSTTGVIKAGHPFAEHIRATMKIEAPEPCGAEFSKATGCPTCGGS